MVQGPSEFRRDLIEFRGRDLEVAVGLLETERRLAGFGGRILEGITRNVADPQRPHELEAGQSCQVLGVPFLQLRVLGLLPDDRIHHDGVAEVIHHRRDGESPACRTGFSLAWLPWPARTLYSQPPLRLPGRRSTPTLRLHFVW